MEHISCQSTVFTADVSLAGINSDWGCNSRLNLFFELVQDSWFSMWIYATIDFAFLVKGTRLAMGIKQSQGEPLGWRYDLYVIKQYIKPPSPKKLSPA